LGQNDQFPVSPNWHIPISKQEECHFFPAKYLFILSVFRKMGFSQKKHQPDNQSIKQKINVFS
jgi:hypothetical protein